MSAQCSLPAPKHLRRTLTIDDYIWSELQQFELVLELDGMLAEASQDQSWRNRLVNLFCALSPF